jgi:F-type H+-transporting ATPase subunit a
MSTINQLFSTFCIQYRKLFLRGLRMEGVYTYFGDLLGFGHDPLALFIPHLILVALIVLVIAKLATKSLRAVPTGSQNVMEAYLSGVLFMGRDVIGEENTRRYLPLIATLGLFIFVSNVIGIIPGFESPTSNINITLALALSVFVFYNFEGMRRQGVIKYMGSLVHLEGMNGVLKWAMLILMYPIELVSHFSRIVSLSFRLFGSIRGDDMFLWVLLMLTPYIIPLAPYALLTVMAVLQTFVFMMLTFVYLAGAVAVHDDH